MEKSVSKELAFFNLLKTLIPTDIKNQSLDYKLSLDDLEEKVEMDKIIISGLIKNLESDGFVEILNETSTEVNLHFERTYDKLIEVFSVDSIEDMIERMQNFVQKKFHHFNLLEQPEPLKKYLKQAMDTVEKEGVAADLNPIIQEGIRETLNDIKQLIRLKKDIYRLCEEASDDDLEDLELILFYQLNFPLEENPFYVVLFLSRLCLEMEREKIS